MTAHWQVLCGAPAGLFQYFKPSNENFINQQVQQTACGQFVFCGPFALDSLLYRPYRRIKGRS